VYLPKRFQQVFCLAGWNLIWESPPKMPALFLSTCTNALYQVKLMMMEIYMSKKFCSRTKLQCVPIDTIFYLSESITISFFT